MNIPLKNSKSLFQKAKTAFQNAETPFQNAETRFQNYNTAQFRISLASTGTEFAQKICLLSRPADTDRIWKIAYILAL